MISIILDVARVKPERRKLRRKLQKLDSRPQSCQIDCIDTVEQVAPDIKKSLFRSRKPKPDVAQIQEKPCPASPTIVDDRPTKHERVDHRASAPPPPVHPTCHSMSSSSSEPIPEFAHLRVNRQHLERAGRDKLPPLRPVSMLAAPPSHRPRRYAKTPVLRIGQLESSASKEHSDTAQNDSSAENIAESYRALLEPCYSVFRDTPVESPGVEQQFERSLAGLRRFQTTPSKSRTGSFGTATIRGSPASDDGTLVGSDEEALNSRSNPYTPELCATKKGYELSALKPATPVLGNPSLEISLDLLTQELFSATQGAHLRPNTGMTSLQVWVMIEAYEKLRDQLLETQAGGDEALVAMFDMWLKALHRLRNQMTEGNSLNRRLH